MSETEVVLSVRDNVKSAKDSIPPVFRLFQADSSITRTGTYSINLSMVDDECGTEGRLLLNYRDVVFIHKNGAHLSVDVAETPSEEFQVLANMGVSLALSYIFCLEDVFMLHAASVVRNGVGFIFPGRSGSGKTTISRLSAAENHVLCDELTAVTMNESRHDMTFPSFYRIFSGPKWAQFTFDPEYYSDAAWRDVSHEAYLLKAVIFPSRSDLRDYTWLERVKSIDAAVSLMMRFTDTAFVRTLPAESHRKAFHFFSQLARSVPCYTMHANIHTDIWKVIDETVGK